MIKETIVYQRPESMCDVVTHYCPGCMHGTVHRVLAELLDEMDLREIAIGIAPVGCAVLAYNYLNCDFTEAAHGRAPAMATGMKRVLPDRLIFTYQGDGDLAAIGAAELIHAAARGENITTVFINNAVYGMTGGQMAPTTLPGMVTSSTPDGRDVRTAGYPVRVCEIVSQIDGAAYIVRRTATNPREIRRLKNALRNAFRVQMAGLGYSLVEVLCNCPTNWGVTPIESINFIEEKMLPYYPLGDYKISPEVEALLDSEKPS
jgi:2-oxoglutarate ferredoxin oxidoreductase subunit beta